MSERSPTILLAVGATLLVAHLAAMEAFRKPDGRVVFGDATHHFVQLRSLVFDRDVHFQNEYVRLYNLQGETPGVEWVTSELTPTGHVRNYMPVGPALLWMPLYLVVAGIQLAFSAVGLVAPPDGFDRVLQLVPGVTGVIAATAAAVVSWRLACRFVAPHQALAGVLAVWLGSHALYYSLVSPAYSHSASMLANALFFWRWLATRDDRSVGRITVWGALAGLAALMRWQDGVLLGVVAIDIIGWRAPLSARAGAALAAVAAFAAVFSPQMAVWNALYGQPLAIPQGAGFMQWTSPHLLDVLVSDNHGLFSWAPLLLLSIVGLVRVCQRAHSIVLPILYAALVSWYVNAAVVDWWAGEAFGARRFLSLFPLFALGAASWLAEGKGPAARAVIASGRGGFGFPTTRGVVVGLLTAANLLLLFQYQLFMKGLTAVAPYPAEFFNLYVARFIVPFRLIERWLGGS